MWARGEIGIRCDLKSTMTLEEIVSNEEPNIEQIELHRDMNLQAGRRVPDASHVPLCETPYYATA